MGLENLLANIYHNTFNLKFALISAGFNGPIAAAVNSSHTNLEMITAGTSQAISSFISTGFTARLVQHFSPIRNPFASYFLGTSIPAAMTFLLSYGAHYINNTPELLESCVTPTIISYVTSFGTNYITRKGYLLPKNYPDKK